ncbi:MAG TPA: hypothetical protein VLF09_05095 [Cellvibrio sp.]|nr:hypothetical protein [Cellvibrio sp.]
MNLMTEVKQKNKQLLLRDAALEQKLSARVNTPAIGSFLVTFIAAPFIIGAMAHCVLGSNRAASRRLYRLALPGLRLWSLR